MIFNHNTVSLTESQKYLEIVLDSRLDFKQHLEIIFKKVSKAKLAIGLLCKLQNLLPRKSLIIVHKSYHTWTMVMSFMTKPYSGTFHRKLGSIQYNAALGITRAIRETSKEKLYHELRFESLEQRCWYRKLCYFFKIFQEQSANYFVRPIPKQNTRYTMRNSKDIPQCSFNHE